MIRTMVKPVEVVWEVSTRGWPDRNKQTKKPNRMPTMRDYSS